MLALGTFAIGTDAYVIAGILSRVANSFDVTVSAAGQLVTVYALAYGLLTPVMAALTEPWPRRRVLWFGLAVFIAGNVLTAVPSSFALTLASRAVAGLVAAVFTPAASATAAALVAPEQRGRALGVVLAGLSGATALGAPLGTLVGSFGDWRLALWFVAALATLAALGVFALLPEVAGSLGLRLRARLAPLADGRVASVLAATTIGMSGVFLVYTYVSVVACASGRRLGTECEVGEPSVSTRRIAQVAAIELDLRRRRAARGCLVTESSRTANSVFRRRCTSNRRRLTRARVLPAMPRATSNHPPTWSNDNAI